MLIAWKSIINQTSNTCTRSWETSYCRASTGDKIGSWASSSHKSGPSLTPPGLAGSFWPTPPESSFYYWAPPDSANSSPRSSTSPPSSAQFTTIVPQYPCVYSLCSSTSYKTLSLSMPLWKMTSPSTSHS